MIVPDYNYLSLQPNDSLLAKKANDTCPHPHRDGSDIEPCRACGRKRISHTETDASKAYRKKKSKDCSDFI